MFPDIYIFSDLVQYSVERGELLEIHITYFSLQICEILHSKGGSLCSQERFVESNSCAEKQQEGTMRQARKRG